jgi:hypothetical protein
MAGSNAIFARPINPKVTSATPYHGRPAVRRAPTAKSPVAKTITRRPPDRSLSTPNSGATNPIRLPVLTNVPPADRGTARPRVMAGRKK